MNREVVKVLLPLKLDTPFDYVAPEPLAPGTVVEVPLGRRKSFGVVWHDPDTPTYQGKDIKPVLLLHDCPPLPAVSQKFINWVADYTLAPKGMLLKMAYPLVDALEGPEDIPLYDIQQVKGKITPQRQKVLERLQHHPCQTLDELHEHTGVSRAVIHGMIKSEILTLKGFRKKGFPFTFPDVDTPGPSLSQKQQEAADHLVNQVTDQSYVTTLLDGVTGSGKTEVYYEAILQALKQGQQALILLPEIALSTQWLDRFEERFGVKPALWHSNLSQAQRRTTWRAIAEGQAPVIVGARSALFLPYPRLGVIVVDEEHDSSYKQEEQVIYNARDMAIVRAQMGQIPCILASATPSLETLINAETEKFDILHLESRFGGATLPDIHVVDLRRAKSMREVNSRKWIAQDLRDALAETVKRGEQAMLFLNRRGYAPLTLCSECGERIQCTQCTSWMVQHQVLQKLHCHHCGTMEDIPSSCPGCHEEETLVACGPGVERIAEEVETFLPNARLGVMTSDTLTSPQKMANLIGQIQDHQLDVIVGTQVMAKGYHFPKLTLVGIVDADLSLSNGDLRAAEKTYQLLHQVAGRSGRADLKGSVWVQTYAPENPVIQALLNQERDRFLTIEAEERKKYGFPPYGRLIALILSGKNKFDVENAAKAFGRTFPVDSPVELLGPAPAPLSLLRGRYRWRLLVKTGRNFPLQSFVKEWVNHVEIRSSVRLQIDVDPYTFL